MERSEASIEAQESYGRRVIVAYRCHHRLHCAGAITSEGQPMHIDGLTFIDEAAAQRFDRRLLARDRGAVRVFDSWAAARLWLREP